MGASIAEPKDKSSPSSGQESWEPERERIVVALHYGRFQSMRAIGKRLRVSESRVSQLHVRALRLLRTQVSRLFEVD